jgi:eukaryotic-like serine/threonine-protein kinase
MSTSLAAGRRMLDRYLLEKQVGLGGMSEVWQARDLVLDRPVAVKVLAGAVARDPGMRIDTRQEARAAARLAHPNITAVYDFGACTDDDGRVLPFLVMELLHGETLADLMSRGPVGWQQTARIGAQIAAALAAAHAERVVHRDVKPGNVLVRPDAVVKITDFGIAWSASSVPLTGTGQVVGTAH